MSEISIYKVITVTHKTCNLKQIGDYIVTGAEEGLDLQLRNLKATFGFTELVYLSTCNRILYLFASPEALDERFVLRFFNELNPIFVTESGQERLRQEVAFYQGQAAVRHIYEVAASVDSLVVGEREILRQLREAYDSCTQQGLAGDNLRLLMRFVVTGAKRVYAETRIGEKPVSVVSLAIKKLLDTRFSKKSRVLLIGAGQTNLLVSKFLKKYEYANVTVFNRTLEKAAKIAAKFEHGKAFALAELPDFSEGFDVMIVCTGAVTPIVGSELYTTLLRGETDPKLVIDLSVPNNVDREIANDFQVNYIEIEHLRQAANANMAFREREVTNAKAILDLEIVEFEQHFKQRQVELAMREIPIRIKAVKEKAVNEVFKKELDGLDAQTIDLMNRMLSYMEKKCISIPMTIAKKNIMI